MNADNSQTPAPRARGRLAPEHWLGLLAAAFWLFLAFEGARRLSSTADEPPHLAAGIAVLSYRDYRMNPEHPMLFKVLATLPMWLTQEVVPELEREGLVLAYWADGDQWRFGHYALYRVAKDPQFALLMARIVPILTGLLGGWIAWLWGSEFGGRRAGLLSMIFLLYYPEYLGHARYVTLDVPTLVSAAGLSWCAWKLWCRPSMQRGIGWAALAGVLALVKLPVAIFAALQWLTAVFVRFMAARQGRVARGVHQIRPLGLAGLLVALVVAGIAAQWCMAGFRFELTNPDVPGLSKRNNYANPPGEAVGVVARVAEYAGIHRLLPEATIAILNHTTAFEGRVQFLLGDFTREGWVYYFFVTILLKTPVVMLLGLRIGGGYAWSQARRHPHAMARVTMLILPFFLLFVLTCLSRVSIGHRHILFIYFPWVVLMGAAAAHWLISDSRWRQRAATATGLWLVFLCAWKQPNQATYFNLIGGGDPLTASAYVLDSNVDWGEGLPQMAEALKENGWDRCNLAAFAIGNPKAWGFGDFNFILPSYPFAVFMPQATEPDPNLPTVVSLNCMQPVHTLYPKLYDREPYHVGNSFVIYAPLRSSSPRVD